MSGLAALLVGRRDPDLYHWDSRLSATDVEHAVAHAGWRAFVLDGRMVTDVVGLHSAIATAVGFPTGYDGTWTALANQLADLSWAPGRGRVLLYEGWGMLARCDPTGWESARAVLTGACAYWRDAGIPFAVLLRGPGPAEGIPELR